MQAPKSILAICLFLSLSLHLLAQDGLLDSVDQRSGVISVEVRFPSKTLVEEHQAKIVAELKQNYYLQNGIRIGVGLAGLAVCYALYHEYTIRIYGPQDKFAPVMVEQMYAFLEKDPAFLLHCRSQINNPEQDAGWVATIASGTTTVVKGLVVLAAQALSLQFLNKTGAQIFHDNSVEWFSREKTSLLEIYDELAAMKEFMHIGALKNRSFYITQYQADQYVSSLIRLYNAIVLELEPIIGYVNYKSHEMNLHQNHLFKRSYDIAQEMHEIRSAYPNYTDNDQRVTAIIKMFDYIELFSLELNSALGGFKRFEKEMHAI
jgi:hypothetical protein